MTNLKVVTLDGTTSTSAVPELKIRRVERDLFGEDRTARVEIPGRDGALTYPEEPGQREIRLVGWLQAEGVAAKRDAIHNLAEWLAPAVAAEVQLIVDDEADRYYNVTAVDWEVDTGERHPVVVIEFAGSAYGYATSASTHTEAASGASPDSGAFNPALDTAVDPVIEITPTNGTITAFELSINGDTIDWSGLLNDDETLTISSLSDTVTVGASGDVDLTGAFDPNAVSMETVAVSGFPELVPGSNSWVLAWTGTATTVDIDFTWRERFI